MTKNKITPKERKLSPPPPPPTSQNSLNTQNNFMSIHELSSNYEREKTMPTISNIRKKYLMQNLINKLKFLIAPYSPPPSMRQNWNQEYKFVENGNEEGTERQSLFSEVKYRYKFWHLLMIIQAICATLLFWASSTEVIFLPKFQTSQDENIFSFQFKIGPSLIIIFKLILKEIFILREKALQNKKQSNEDDEKQLEQMEERKQTNYQDLALNIKDLSKSLIYGGACVIYLFIHVISVPSLRSILQAIMSIVFFLKVFNLKENLEKVYSYVESRDYKNQFRIVALFFVILLTCHLMALVLYAITYLYPDENWVNVVNKIAVRENNWLSHYTCSIYFTITTMATVGYGDFSPVQMGQMVLVSFIQLFGTALFGYMINVVGLSVVEINKKNQEFDNHISTINKLQSHYQISRQLCQKFKDDIVKNESVKKQTPLSEIEQTQFFKIIQNSLKQQFILQTNIKVIKKSIFFLTHFTVNFQNEIALKLIRKIYKKNQRVPLAELESENNDRCMLIINSGSVDIEIVNHQVNNGGLRKFIKNISPQEGKPTLNVFGYSALILNRDIDLEATTQETSVIYLLKRKDVLQCMDKNMLDFQGISQLRQRMLNYKNINYIQAPSLIEIDKHYVPNVYFINKKKKNKNQNRDVSHKRSQRKCRIKVITLKNFQFRTMMCIDLDDSSNQEIFGAKLAKQENSLSDYDLHSPKPNSEAQLIENGSEAISKLDQYKNFQNFMKKSNISHLTHKYHEYLRELRKNRKMMQKVQKMLNESQTRELKTKNFTFTQGMNFATFRRD